MKVFIFGAGASVASQGQVPYSNEALRAPLVDDLFNPRYQDHGFKILTEQDFEECRKGTSQGSLETWLTERWESIQNLKQSKTQYAERAFFGRITYYIWNLFQKVSTTYTDSNAYTAFLRKLRERDEAFGLISFNYDTLLDRAYQGVYGPPLLSLDDYEGFQYVKPHGSVNWLMYRRAEEKGLAPDHQQDVSTRIRYASANIFNGPTLPFERLRVLDASHQDLNDISALFYTFENQYFYPLVLMPLTSKLYPIVASFHEKILEQGKKLIASADEVFLIGYRANDELIHELLAEARSDTKLHVIGRDSAPAIADKVIKRHQRLKLGRASQDGFLDFVDNYGR